MGPQQLRLDEDPRSPRVTLLDLAAEAKRVIRDYLVSTRDRWAQGGLER